MSSDNNIQQLHVGLLGTRLTGWITKWTGKYGFVRAYSYSQEGRILLTPSQFKDTGMPSAGLRVEFTLDRNERGWRAVNCRRIVGQSGATADNTETATLTDDDPRTAALEGKFPVLYKPEEISSAQLELFEQSMRLFRLLGECESPFVPISHRVLIETYMKLMKEFRQDIEDEVFALYPSSTLRVNWHRIKVIQNLKKTGKNTHSITMQDVRRLDSFQRFLQCPTFTVPLTELLSEYTTNISTSTALPAFAKAAWMFVHLHQLVTDHSRDGEENDMFHSVYLLMNWVLLQQGVPFMADSIFPEVALRRNIQDTSSKAVHNWLLFCLMDMCRDFDERMKFALQSSSSEPQDPEKIVNNHRKEMLESGMCSNCSDKSVKCTVSMLCCGSSIHAHCLQKWRKSREEEYDGKCLVAPCPGCRRGCVEPLIERQRNNPPIASGSPRPAAVISSNNAYAALQDNDED